MRRFSLRAGALWAAGPLALLSLSLGLGIAACHRQAPPIAGVPDRVDFNFHVKPLLSDRCFKCHGPDDRQRKGGLRLDVQASALATLESGHRAVVPGSTSKSELVRRITSTDPKVMMPAADSHLTLDEVEKATLVRWIEQGAEWKPHWSFIPPGSPAPPAVATSGWARGEVDRFVLAALEAKGWKPSPEAPRETWLRRVSFDLTGLPPAAAEIDAFLADRSPDAYERVVDRLLASPAYGERMAADWLDIARYADSHGYQDDGMREMWPWRDWVISAFNRNLRVDDFITWQLAGDLLPNPTQEQRIATGFNRNHMQSQEGGIVAEEYRTEYVVDRVNTLGRAVLGLSVECARCHDHKYDPITQREFYRLYAFFNNVNEVGQIPYSGVPSPTAIVTTPEVDAKLAALAARIATLEAELDPAASHYDAGYAHWLATAADAARASIAQPPGLIAHFPFEAPHPVIEPPKVDPKKPPPAVKKPIKPILVLANLVDAKERGRVGDVDRPTKTVPGKVGDAQQLVGDSYIEAGKTIAFFERNEPFSIAFWFRVDRAGTSGPLFARSGAVMNGNRGYDIDLRADGTLTAGLHHVDPDNAVEVVTTAPVVKPGSWQHVTLTWDGSSRAGGIGLFVDGARPPVHVVIDHLQRSILHDGRKKNWDGGKTPMRFGRRGDERLDGVSIDELRVFDRQLSRLEVGALAGETDPLGAILRTPAPARSTAQQAALREHYLLRVAPTAAVTRRALAAVRGEENDLLTSRVEVMAMRDRAEPRPTFVLARGAYDAPTDRVEPGTPAALGRVSQGPPGQPPRPGALADVARASADVAGDRQSHLGAAVRTRAGRDAGRLRQPGPAADASVAARLAGDALRRLGMESQGAAEAARAVGDLPAIVDCRRRGAGTRSRQRMAVARPGVSALGRTGARRRPGRRRPARFQDRRAERLPVSAGGPVGGARHPQRHDLRGRQGRRPVSAEPLHGVEALVAAAIGDQLRRRRTPFLHGEPAADQHAAAGARAAERSAVRGGGAGPRGADDPRGGRRRRRPDRGRLPRAHRPRPHVRGAGRAGVAVSRRAGALPPGARRRGDAARRRRVEAGARDRRGGTGRRHRRGINGDEPRRRGNETLRVSP